MPNELCGALIGGKGKAINRLRDRHSIDISVDQRYQDKRSRDVAKTRRVIFGPASPATIRRCVSDAFDVLIDAPLSDATKRGHKDFQHAFTILLTGAEMGALIGRNGSRINAIRDKTGVRLKVSKDRDEDSGFADVSGSRFPKLREAFDMLIEAISSEARVNLSKNSRARSMSNPRKRRRAESPPKRDVQKPRPEERESRRTDRRNGAVDRSRSRSRGSRHARPPVEPIRNGVAPKKAESPPPRAKKQKKKSKSRSRKKSESVSRGRSRSRSGREEQKSPQVTTSASRSPSGENAYSPLVCTMIIPRSADLSQEQLHEYAETSKAQICRTKEGVQVSGTPSQVQISVTLLCRGLQESGVIFAPAQ